MSQNDSISNSDEEVSDNRNVSGSNNKRSGAGSGGGGFKSIILPIISGIVGALIVLGLYLLFTSGDDDGSEETGTDEETASEVDSSQDLSEVKQQLEEENTDKVITDTTAAVQKAKPAVVSVINMQRIQSIIPGMTEGSDEAEEAGSGSGVIYKTDGDISYVVTNHHVVDGAEEIKINLKAAIQLTRN